MGEGENGRMGESPHPPILYLQKNNGTHKSNIFTY
jgi:hypothetical protein